MIEDNNPSKEIDKPLIRGNVLLRQELKSLTPKCDVQCAILFNLCLMITFSIFGIPILLAAQNIVEYYVEYSNCVSDSKGYCTITLKTNQTIPAPVYLYYEIHNFYMNHRDFVKSRNFAQLRGEIHVDSSNNSRCEGAKYMYEMMDNDTSKYMTFSKSPLKADDFANPCGLIAKSYFNDTDYTLTNSSGTNIKIDDSDIANDFDKKYMFKRNENYKTLQWIDVEDQHFIVWMQMESFQNFRKLWGKINQELKPDTYTIRVLNRYNVSSFNGQKGIVLGNSSSIGTGSFFGWFLMTGAIFSFVLIIILYILKIKNQDKTYSLNDLKWK